MLDEKQLKKFTNLITKLSNVFSDCYFVKSGYVVTLDVEKPFIVQIDLSYIDMMIDVLGEFGIARIDNLKEFKKDMTTHFYVVKSEKEKNNVLSYIDSKMKQLSDMENWKSFINSKEDDVEVIESLFKLNTYIEFKPADVDGPAIILTKSLIPMVTEKTCDALYYSAKKLADNLYIIIFDFQFELFRLIMFHNYIRIEE